MSTAPLTYSPLNLPVGRCKTLSMLERYAATSPKNTVRQAMCVATMTP